MPVCVLSVAFQTTEVVTKCLVANCLYATAAKALLHQFLKVNVVLPSVAEYGYICFNCLPMITKYSGPHCNGCAVSWLAGGIAQHLVQMCVLLVVLVCSFLCSVLACLCQGSSCMMEAHIIA